ncbi:hypothetical protein KW805_01925 [Candidatus Pacearchaeota archaeon]|nr:hypothetical protein [Candidatus Pacearchaeota archaeon]
MDEKKREEIKKEAQKILERFSRSLENVKFKEKTLKRPAGGYREEGKGMECDPDFRKKMFENAENKNDDFIIAEKKSW